MKEDLSKADEILKKYREKKGALISVMQDVQSAYGYLPLEVLKYLSKELKTPLSQIGRVATFYASFSLKPKGKNIASVCTGTACHVRGAVNILERLERELSVKTGDTAEDLSFSLETVRCLGCCGLAPVVKINADTYGKVKEEKIPKILRKYKE